MVWIGRGLGTAMGVLGLGLAVFGLTFFSEDVIAGLGAEAAEQVRPDYRLAAGLGALVVLAVSFGLWLRQIKEASLYLISMLSGVGVSAMGLLGLSNWIFFESLYAETSWLRRTGDNLLGVVPGTLSSLVGSSSGEDAALRAGAGVAKGLGRTLVDMVRHPGFEAIPDGPLTLMVGLPLLFAFIVFNVGVAPKIAARFHTGQPLWLRLSAHISLLAALFLVLAAVYLNLLARQSVNFAGTLAG